MRSNASFNEYSFVDFYSKPSLNILEAIGFGFQSVSTEFVAILAMTIFRRCTVWHVVFLFGEKHRL